MEELEVEDERTVVLQKLEKIERPLSYLSDKTGIPYNTLHSCLVRKLFRISEENTKKIASFFDNYN